MRLHFFLSPNHQPVSFNYQPYLTGTFHKWPGPNQLHDALSRYSLSWLYEGRACNGMIEFPRDAHWFISLHDESLAELLVNHALSDPEVCCDMRVTRITVICRYSKCMSLTSSRTHSINRNPEP